MRNPNLNILRLTIAELGDMVDEFVFVGGCATGLLITDQAAPPIRETIDVDVIVELGSVGDYYRLSARLRKLGFREDTSEGAPICRWKKESLLLDVMPTDEKILGFGNRWYGEALENASRMRLPSGESISVVSSPYFLITKLLAFEGRGNGDFQASHDLEDFIAVVDGRPELVAELRDAPIQLRQELQQQIKLLLTLERFVAAIPGHMPGDESSQARVPLIIDRMEQLVQLV
jgi:predicted nucleotidyltransferase